MTFKIDRQSDCISTKMWLTYSKIFKYTNKEYHERELKGKSNFIAKFVGIIIAIIFPVKCLSNYKKIFFMYCAFSLIT